MKKTRLARASFQATISSSNALQSIRSIHHFHVHVKLAKTPMVCPIGVLCLL